MKTMKMIVIGNLPDDIDERATTMLEIQTGSARGERGIGDIMRTRPKRRGLNDIDDTRDVMTRRKRNAPSDIVDAESERGRGTVRGPIEMAGTAGMGARAVVGTAM